MKTDKRAIFWNMLGSIANASTSVLLLIIVTRCCGTDIAGKFSITYVTAQMMMMIGNYGVRAFQASDVSEEFSFNEYLENRIFTCIIMMIISGLWGYMKRYNQELLVLLLAVCFYKMIDAFSDVFEGYLQQHDRMDLAGKSLFFRTAITMLIFTVCLVIWKDLQITMYVVDLSAIILLFFFSIVPVQRMNKIKLLHSRSMWKIFKLCGTLCASLFLLSYIINIPKYALEKYTSYDQQTYYNIIYMPAQVIYLLSTFIFKPYIANMSVQWEKDKKIFSAYISKMLWVIMGVSVICNTIAVLIGTKVLGWLYGVNVYNLKVELFIIMLGGGFNAISSMLYYALTIMRMQKLCFASYMISFLLSSIVSFILVYHYELMGAAMTYLISMFIIAGIMFGVIKHKLRLVSTHA